MSLKPTQGCFNIITNAYSSNEYREDNPRACVMTIDSRGIYQMAKALQGLADLEQIGCDTIKIDVSDGFVVKWYDDLVEQDFNGLHVPDELHLSGEIDAPSEANLLYTSISIDRAGFMVTSIHKHSETGDMVNSIKIYWSEIDGLADALREAAKRPLALMPEFSAKVESDRRDLRNIILEDAPSDDLAIIPAKAYSDDRVVQISFDAAKWFEQASDQAILDLAECGWGGDYPADVIVYYDYAKAVLSKGHDKIRHLFAYLDAVRDTSSACGFECHVDEEVAMEWIKDNRPHLLEQIHGMNAGSSFSPA